MTYRMLALLLGAVFLYSCTTKPKPQAENNADPKREMALSDAAATPLARALFRNLQALSGDHVLLGHQDALAYGMGWNGGDYRTDIHDAIGEHPAVYGWDLGHMGDEKNIDSVYFTDMQQWAMAVYNKGGINTYSWHMRNYAMGGSSWDRDSCVAACLPGGKLHTTYVEKLDQAAAFFSGITTSSGDLVPVIFRPFHEMTGGWFWWGKGNCSVEDYKALFRFTVDYLRKEKSMHQLIIAYSTDKFEGEEAYMEFYPGDAYVDVLAFDDYHHITSKEGMPRTIHMLEVVDSLARARGKLTAISETGMETLPYATWYSEVVLPLLKHSEATRRTAWILFWRNGRPDHYYAPYPGHPTVPDFKAFMDDPLMLGLSELPDLYH
jgi:mannan endo-1,4-beta-mannosidase